MIRHVVIAVRVAMRRFVAPYTVVAIRLILEPLIFIMRYCFGIDCAFTLKKFIDELASRMRYS